MAEIISFSIPDEEAELINEIKNRKKKGIWSKEIVRLLKTYYLDKGGTAETISKEEVELIQNKKTLEEIKKTLKKIEKSQEDLKEKIESKKIQDHEEDLNLIRLLEDHFEDIKGDPLNWYHQLKTTSERAGRDPKQSIEKRLSKFASDNKISIKKAWELFFKIYPQLKELIT